MKAARQPAAHVVAEVIGANASTLETRLQGVRTGDDPVDVHQARVATRRLRADLRTFGPLLAGNYVDEVRAELSWLGSELGVVRDLDVLRGRLDGAATSLAAADRHRATPVLAVLDGERRAARARLLAALRDPRVEALQRRLGPPLPFARRAERKAGKVLPPLADRPVARLERAVAALGDDPTDEELHQVRLKAKRARYALEAVGSVAGKPARRRAKRLARLQTVLGDLRDGATAEAWLRDVAHRERDPATARVLGEMIGHERAAQRRDHADWSRRWKAARR